MLELYHGGHTTCSRKARLCLREKALPYKSHFLNLRGFEQHAPEYLALANVAVVGGPWLTPADAIAAGDWPRIERLARDAASRARKR